MPIQNPLLIWLGISLAIALAWLYRTARLLATLKRTHQLKIRKPGVAPSVTVLIPAKNEEKNIRACWESLKNQDYPNYEILVVNDNSSDQTEVILKSLGAKYINSPPAPQGWTGKNHALYYGSREVKSEWLLFTDADTRHEPGSISSAIAHAEENKLQFLTLLPHCLTGSLIEDFLEPIAMAFIGLWFPLEKVNDPASPLYFANGQYLMIRRELYEKLGGHEGVRGEFLEDFALMKKTKEARARAECAFGTNLYGTRMYDSFDTLWRGWRRIYLHAFRRNPILLSHKALGVLFFSILPFVFFLSLGISGEINLSKNPLLVLSSAGTLALILITTWQTYGLVKAKKIYSLLHPFAAIVILFILLDAIGMALGKKQTVWR